MELTFANTHNMITYLTKSDASEGFDQIIDFLNASSIKYALTVNPNVYVSCIKQFWTSVSVKKVNDVTRLQALVDKKKVIISEATIRDDLRLDDAESIDCLPNEEIFTELSSIGYGKPSTKLTFYKAFFSPQWKFIIHTILQCMSPKRTSWNKFSSSMASSVIFLSIGGVGDGIDGSSTAVRTISALTSAAPSSATPAAGTSSTLTSVALSLTCCATSIPSNKDVSTPKNPFPTLFMLANTFCVRAGDDYFVEWRIIASMDEDVNVTLKDVAKIAKEVALDAEIEESADVQGSMQDDEIEPTELQEVVEVVTTAKLMTKVVTVASATITTAVPILTTVAAPTLTNAPSATRRRKGVRKEKEDNAVMRYQALKRKPQTKAQAIKNMMIYLKNMFGFKMDYFKGMTYDDIRLIFDKNFNSNVAFLEKTRE
nr:hypothetical protein [Tanacetum cinerariifolium]